MTAENPIVIVGTGLAGYTLAREVRKLDKTVPITLVTADDGHSYSKPMLSTAVAKGKSAEDLSMANAGKMAAQLGVTVRTFATVTGVHPDQHSISLGEETLPYRQLVLAWGADVVRPKLEGNALDQVFSINDLQDYRRFRACLEGKRRVLILGAGLIGCEFANDLLSGEFSVEIVAPSSQVLPGLLPTPAAEALQAALMEQGVEFHLGKTALSVNHTDQGIAVRLDDESLLEVDIVVSAVGLKPRIQLVKDTLACQRGILVNRALETSREDVYALGDCAEVDGQVMLYVAPLMACARALAKTLTGERSIVTYSAMPVIVKTPVCPVVIALPPENTQGDWVFEGGVPDIKGCFTDEAGALRGFVLTGEFTENRQSLAKALPDIHQS